MSNFKLTIAELIANATAAGRALLTAADAAAQKVLLSLSKSDVGLGNVDNTSDANKPVSTAQAAAIAAKIGGAVGATTNRLVKSSGTDTLTVQSTGITVDGSNNVSGVGTISSGAITASGNVNIGANSLVGTYSGIYNDGKWLTGSDNYGSFYISPSNASFAFAPPAAGEIVGTIDFAGRFNATTGFAVGSDNNVNTTVRYYRNATGPKASIRAAGGLEVKDLAGSADAALTCGAITASDAVKTGLKLFSALPAASASTDCIFTVTDRSGRPLAKSDGTNWYNVFTGAILT